MNKYLKEIDDFFVNDFMQKLKSDCAKEGLKLNIEYIYYSFFGNVKKGNNIVYFSYKIPAEKAQFHTHLSGFTYSDYKNFAKTAKMLCEGGCFDYG